MGNLRERSCDNCVNLFEAISIGVCEAKRYTVEKVGDADEALTCEFYINKFYPEEQEEN